MLSAIRIVLVAILIVVVVLLIWWFSTKEDFETKREKASAIREWFNQNSDPQYNTYKTQVPESDIVEYDKIRALYGSGETPALADIEGQL